MKKLFACGLAAVLLGACAAPAPPPPSPGLIGYPDVASVQRMLAGRGDVRHVDLPGGWTAAVEPSDHIVWAFVPDTSLMAPAVVKRQRIYREERTLTRTTSLCEGRPDACEQLMTEYASLTPQVDQLLQETAPPGR
jgi:hypothetical protein